MSRKATVRSPSNIAFIKYWGARDLERVIPENPSLSMTLRECTSRSTVEHLDGSGEHEILWRGSGGSLETAPPAFAQRVEKHLDFLRERLGSGGRFRVATENTFPSAAGIASSASGFSALALAVLAALDHEATVEERSELARLSGSGSASRSVLGGYVEWPASGADLDAGDGGHARQVATAEHWDLRDVIAVVESGPKKTSSLDGHRRARTSPYFARRLERLPESLAGVRRAILERDFARLGPLVEAEAIDLHMIAMTSEPPIFYWRPATLKVLEAVRDMRGDGVEAACTMDAGANVHVICPASSEGEVAARLSRLAEVQRIIRDGVGSGPVREEEHLL